MSDSKWLSAVLVVAVLAAGPVAPIAAMAQSAAPTTAPPAPPPASPQPPPASPQPPPVSPQPPPVSPQPPPVSSQPQPPPMQSMQPETVEEPVTAAPGTGAKIGAGVLNVVYVPGKAILCTAGTLVAGAFMLATFGSAHREAVSFFNEGCGGAWLLTPEQVAAAPKKAYLEPSYSY